MRRAPGKLVITEVKTLLQMLDADAVTKTLLATLYARESSTVKEYPTALVKGENAQLYDLNFATTLGSRAALGYGVLQAIIVHTSNLDTQQSYTKVEKLCAPYVDLSAGIRSKDRIVGRLVHIFVEPVINYIEITLEADDFVCKTMVKYKQRCEWFEGEQLKKLVMQGCKDKGPRNYDDVERRLKRDFYHYLFDQGLDFSIEVVSPGETGKADVMTGMLGNDHRLIVETKVHDGKSRNEKSVEDGVPQAAYYATDWGEPYVYLLVYNVAKNTKLIFKPSTPRGGTFVFTCRGVQVRAISVDLENDLSPSRASKLNEVSINTQRVTF